MRVLAGLLLTVSGALACAHGSYVQPQADKLLEQAETALTAGRFDEATAGLEAIGIGRPVRVALNLDEIAPEYRLRYQLSLYEAMSEWEIASHGLVRWTLVRSGGAAIRIKGINKATYTSHHVAGRADWTRSVRTLGGQPFGTLRADIEVGLHAPDGKAMSGDALRHIITHELGHVLGLADTPFRGEVMGPLDPADPALELGENDLSAISALADRALVVHNGLQYARRD